MPIHIHISLGNRFLRRTGSMESLAAKAAATWRAERRWFSFWRWDRESATGHPSDDGASS